jgi:MSHA pilin protein MshC
MKNQKIKADIYGKRGFSPGFTFIEIIVVLLILGILGAVALEHSLNYEADLAGAVEVVKGHLRYAQIKAINSDVKWGLAFAGNTYSLQDQNGVGGNLPGDLPQNITFTASTNPVMFDQDGSPGGTSITIILTKGNSRTITVIKNTGFIQ